MNPRVISVAIPGKVEPEAPFVCTVVLSETVPPGIPVTVFMASVPPGSVRVRNRAVPAGARYREFTLQAGPETGEIQIRAKAMNSGGQWIDSGVMKVVRP